MGAAYCAPYVGRMTDAGKNVSGRRQQQGQAHHGVCMPPHPHARVPVSSLLDSVHGRLPSLEAVGACLLCCAPTPLTHRGTRPPATPLQGIQEAARMQKIVDLGGEEGHMRLLVASIRSADEVAALSAEGCNTFTLSPAVAAQLFDEPLTIAAAELFQEHADEMGAMRGH